MFTKKKHVLAPPVVPLSKLSCVGWPSHNITCAGENVYFYKNRVLVLGVWGGEDVDELEDRNSRSKEEEDDDDGPRGVRFWKDLVLGDYKINVEGRPASLRKRRERAKHKGGQDSESGEKTSGEEEEENGSHLRNSYNPYGMVKNPAMRLGSGILRKRMRERLRNEGSNRRLATKEEASRQRAATPRMDSSRLGGGGGKRSSNDPAMSKTSLSSSRPGTTAILGHLKTFPSSSHSQSERKSWRPDFIPQVSSLILHVRFSSV